MEKQKKENQKKISEKNLKKGNAVLAHPPPGGGMVRLRVWLPEIAYFEVDKIVDKMLITFFCFLAYVNIKYYFCIVIRHKTIKHLRL